MEIGLAFILPSILKEMAHNAEITSIIIGLIFGVDIGAIILGCVQHAQRELDRK